MQHVREHATCHRCLCVNGFAKTIQKTVSRNFACRMWRAGAFNPCVNPCTTERKSCMFHVCTSLHRASRQTTLRLSTNNSTSSASLFTPHTHTRTQTHANIDLQRTCLCWLTCVLVHAQREPAAWDNLTRNKSTTHRVVIERKSERDTNALKPDGPTRSPSWSSCTPVNSIKTRPDTYSRGIVTLSMRRMMTTAACVDRNERSSSVHVTIRKQIVLCKLIKNVTRS